MQMEFQEMSSLEREDASKTHMEITAIASCSNSNLWRNTSEDYEHTAAWLTDHSLVSAFTSKPSALTMYFNLTFYFYN